MNDLLTEISIRCLNFKLGRIVAIAPARFPETDFVHGFGGWNDFFDQSYSFFLAEQDGFHFVFLVSFFFSLWFCLLFRFRYFFINGFLFVFFGSISTLQDTLLGRRFLGFRGFNARLVFSLTLLAQQTRT